MLEKIFKENLLCRSSKVWLVVNKSIWNVANIMLWMYTIDYTRVKPFKCTWLYRSDYIERHVIQIQQIVSQQLLDWLNRWYNLTGSTNIIYFTLNYSVIAKIYARFEIKLNKSNFYREKKLLIPPSPIIFYYCLLIFYKFLNSFVENRVVCLQRKS